MTQVTETSQKPLPQGNHLALGVWREVHGLVRWYRVQGWDRGCPPAQSSGGGRSRCVAVWQSHCQGATSLGAVLQGRQLVSDMRKRLNASECVGKAAFCKLLCSVFHALSRQQGVELVCRVSSRHADSTSRRWCWFSRRSVLLSNARTATSGVLWARGVRASLSGCAGRLPGAPAAGGGKGDTAPTGGFLPITCDCKRNLCCRSGARRVALCVSAQSSSLWHSSGGLIDQQRPAHQRPSPDPVHLDFRASISMGALDDLSQACLCSGGTIRCCRVQIRGLTALPAQAAGHAALQGLASAQAHLPRRSVVH